MMSFFCWLDTKNWDSLAPKQRISFFLNSVEKRIAKGDDYRFTTISLSYCYRRGIFKKLRNLNSCVRKSVSEMLIGLARTWLDTKRVEKYSSGAMSLAIIALSSHLLDSLFFFWKHFLYENKRWLPVSVNRCIIGCERSCLQSTTSECDLQPSNKRDGWAPNAVYTRRSSLLPSQTD